VKKLQTKFERLSKEEKKEAINGYYQTKKGQINKDRFFRLKLIGGICLIWSVYLVVDAFIRGYNIWNYIMATLLFIFGIIFFVGRYKVLCRDVNNYLINKQSKKQ